MALRHALRSLRRTPGFTATVVLTLAVGIASVASMFAIVHGVLLAPLPYGQPERLVSIGLHAPDAGELRQPPALQVTYSELARTLDGVGFHRTGSTNVWRDGGDDVAESVVATWISASMIPLLQVPPLLGRSFTADEELRGGPDAVILSEAEWRSRFEAAPDVIGKTLMVNSVRRQIVGVMPARFSFPPHNDETRLWLPAKRIDDATVGDFAYAAVARLAPGITAGQAQRELAAVLPRMAEAFPRMQGPIIDRAGAPVADGSTATWLAELRPTPTVRPLHDEITDDIARTVWLLAVAAVLVLLVAWANVVNLLLIRADGRQSEFAVRAALGATRWRTRLHFLAEAVLLGVAASVIALPTVLGAVQALVAFGPADIPRLATLGVGPSVVAFIVLVAGLGVVVCTAVPASRRGRTGLSGQLREGGRGASAGRSRIHLRAAITTLQIALALVVTIGSALLLRTALGLYRVHPGFATAQVTTFRTQLPSARYDAADSVAFYTRLAERASGLPSVRGAGVAMRLPLAGGRRIEQTFAVVGVERTRTLPMNIVDRGYFAAMSIPILAGSGFREPGVAGEDEVVIDRLAAAALFGEAAGTAVIGKQLALDASDVTYTVVGVVGALRDEDLARAPEATVYRPLAVPREPAAEPATPGNMALVVKSDGPSDALVATIRALVHELDPTVPIYRVETMTEVVRASTARLALVLAMMTAAATITLVLGAVGLYGVMAYMVALRRREFGVRLALGAGPAQIARLVASRALALTASGLATGFLLYALAAPSLRAFLFGVTAFDPATLAGAILVLLGTAALASWLPARSAARVDPAGSLRAE